MGLGVRVVRGLALSCVVLGGIFVGAGVATVASTGVAVAQTANSIVVEGNRRVEAATIRSYFHPGPGGRLGAAGNRRGAQGALRHRPVLRRAHQSRPRPACGLGGREPGDQSTLPSRATRRPRTSSSQAEVQSKPRGTLSKPTVQADVQRIIEIYHRSGRFNVSVVPKIIELPNNRVNLVFEIKEGEKTGVKEIQLRRRRTLSRMAA